MVRKWSYLESSTLNLDVQSLENTSQLYHFKVFRKTTRFKKFNRGITRMVRKNYARRKHRTNWLILSYITKSWVTNYLKMRQFERFYSSLGRFPLDVFSTNFSVFSLRVSMLTNRNGINIASCAKTLLSRHINNSYDASFLKNPTKNTNSAIVQLSNLADVTSSLEIYPNLVNLENMLYPYGDMLTSLSDNQNLDVVTRLNADVLRTSLQISTSVYSVLILLTLLNTNQPKH